ncbi:heavy metal-binding protein HIP-like isoform X1 [Electrophorus electricus]|uniref:heavy metal-binding protein HIP-like isoform X1 n=2 Tax=Electrophorus electricus TaxID=8005 RepID=UPI0015CF83B1|nr:heavy metal-binding protein HIP-like isoform X1 [Electrophorus electricus]
MASSSQGAGGEDTTSPHLDVTTELVNLRDRITEIRMELRYMEKENAALEARVTTAELELKTLKEKSQVAFSASLADSVGPFNVDSTIVYPKVITNVGQAYNLFTGIFTAPVRGIYYIGFTACGNADSNAMALNLYKNSDLLTNLAKYSNGYMTYFSGGVTVQLEAGDVVYTQLPANSKLYDDHINNRTVFSGFLVITV